MPEDRSWAEGLTGGIGPDVNADMAMCAGVMCPKPDCPEPEQVCIDEFCRTPIECRVDEDCAGSEICDERGQCVPR